MPILLMFSVIVCVRSIFRDYQGTINAIKPLQTVLTHPGQITEFWGVRQPLA
jgi:hypothetical protein